MTLLTVTASKPSPDAKVGIVFATHTENGKQIIVVKSISETSIFADSALQAGFQIIKVNDVAVTDLTLQEAIELVKMAKERVQIIARERYGATATATISKVSNDMKTGVILGKEAGGCTTFIKEFNNTSPFMGKLPVGPNYEVTAINGENVKGKAPQEVVAVIASVPKGDLTIEMARVVVTASTKKPTLSLYNLPTPPGAPAGGQWGHVKYAGSKTGAFACLGCLCFGIPGLLVLACPTDEKDVYRVNGKLYEADGKRCPVPVQKFVPHGPETHRRPGH